MKTRPISRQAPAVVINSGNSNGYGVVVNLGRQGIPVLSVDFNPRNVTFYSKYAKRVLSPDPTASQNAYIEFLVNLGKSLIPKPVLFVTGDEMVLIILAHRDKLEACFHMPMAPLEIARKLLVKKEFYRMLDQFSVPHAKTYSPGDLSEVEALCTDLDYPYILKPSRSSNFAARFHNKCLRIDSPDALIECYKKVTAQEKEVILQQELLGTERYLVYTCLDSSSRPMAVNCYKKVRIFPIDYGNACACETVWEPEAVAMTLSTLTKMGYRGLAEAEVHRDARDGQLKLVEINARSTTEARLSAHCGMNMEYFVYRDALGMDIGKIPEPRPGVKWFDIIVDIQSIFFPAGYLSHRRITIMQWLKSYSGEKEFAFWAGDDPIPFMVLFSRFWRNLFHKLLKRLTFRNGS